MQTAGDVVCTKHSLRSKLLICAAVRPIMSRKQYILFHDGVPLLLYFLYLVQSKPP